MSAIRALPLLAVAAALAVAASGFGARLGVWDWRVGFAVLRWATYAALGIAAVALVALLVPTLRSAHRNALAIALVVALAAAALPLSLLQVARSVPPINDITTDTANPPAFVAIVPLRSNAPVPAAYPGESTATAQRAGYPDIAPAVIAKEPRAAFVAALAVAREAGWTIVSADATAGRIEATATTPWFGFEDDVVIRVTPAGSGSRVDVRSVSRVGKGDLGANARRVREFVAKVAS
ncbi:hypothetical protein BURK1_02547 [Burkholderiales bacterium]|nr:hypothetical protein BURK1_02547 [Burkholderiales bacterium]